MGGLRARCGVSMPASGAGRHRERERERTLTLMRLGQLPQQLARPADAQRRTRADRIDRVRDVAPPELGERVRVLEERAKDCFRVSRISSLGPGRRERGRGRERDAHSATTPSSSSSASPAAASKPAWASPAAQSLWSTSAGTLGGRGGAGWCVESNADEVSGGRRDDDERLEEDESSDRYDSEGGCESMAGSACGARSCWRRLEREPARGGDEDGDGPDNALRFSAHGPQLLVRSEKLSSPSQPHELAESRKPTLPSLSSPRSRTLQLAKTTPLLRSTCCRLRRHERGVSTELCGERRRSGREREGTHRAPP